MIAAPDRSRFVGSQAHPRFAGLESQHDAVKAERDAIKAALNAHGIEFDNEHFEASTDELRIAEIDSDTLP